MGAGGSAQAHASNGAPAYHVTHRGRDQLLVLCTEYVEIRNYDGTGPKTKISLFDIASWTSSPSKFVLNISRSRPGRTLEKGTISMATLEAAAIAGRVGGAARQLQGKMAKHGVPDKDVRAQMKSMKEEVSLEQLRTYTGAHKFTSIQGVWLLLCLSDRFVRLDAACLVLPQLLHVSTLRWVVQQCFEEPGDWSNLQARLKGLMSPDIIALISPDSEDAEAEAICLE